MSRIIRVKFLYRAAVDELGLGHPFAAGMAVSLLQDAVEAMAHEVAASVNAKISGRANFLDHWDAVAVAPGAGGKSLPYRIEMTELNVARVGFKHQGVDIDLSAAEKYQSAAHRFLVDTARAFFDTDFDNLSEADLITNVKVRAAIKRAEGALSGDGAKSALEHCREALDEVESLMKVAALVSEKDSVPPVPKDLPGAGADLVQWTLRRFVALEKSVALSVLKVNPADYWFLYDSLPTRTGSGTFYWRPTKSPISTQTEDRARACTRIIVNLALRAERIHADLQRLAVRSGVIDEQKRLREWRERLPEQQTPDTSE